MAVTRDQLKAAARHATGFASFACVLLGVWALWGWPVAAIVAGIPTGGFYVWGEVRAARGAEPGGFE